MKMKSANCITSKKKKNIIHPGKRLHEKVTDASDLLTNKLVRAKIECIRRTDSLGFS